MLFVKLFHCRGRTSGDFKQAERDARESGRGLWAPGVCDKNTEIIKKIISLQRTDLCSLQCYAVVWRARVVTTSRSVTCGKSS